MSYPTESNKKLFLKCLTELSKLDVPYFPVSAIRQIALDNQLPITKGTVYQYLFEAVKNNIVFDAGRGWYSSLEKPFVLTTKPVNNLITVLLKGFPLLDFSCWSTEQINPFAQHLMSQFLTFVYVEPDSIEPVSAYLRDRGYSVYANPGKSIINESFRIVGKSVILRKPISKQPSGRNHVAPIEKILIDLVWESQKIPFIDESEAQIICNNAVASARLNLAELLGYARRRILGFGWLNVINQIQKRKKTGFV